MLTYGLAAVLAASPAVGIAAGRSQSAASSMAGAPRIRIDNFGQINTAYYRGAQPDERDYTDLAALGIKMVIDLQQDGRADEERLATAAGMKFHRIPMTVHVPPTSEQLAAFLRLVNDPANQPVYVHCAGGRHRTGVMTAVYRMTRDGWSADQAFKEMKQYEFGPDFMHPEFKKFVYGYHVPPPTNLLALQTATVPGAARAAK
jgi:protein tyrosine/serine phosphatase